MSLARVKLFLEFIMKHSPFIINLTCLHFSTNNLISIALFIREIELWVTKLIVAETQLNITLLTAIKPFIDMLQSVEFQITEHPNTEHPLSQLSRSWSTKIKIFVVSEDREINTQFQKGCLLHVGPPNSADPNAYVERYMWHVKVVNDILQSINEVYDGSLLRCKFLLHWHTINNVSFR